MKYRKINIKSQSLPMLNKVMVQNKRLRVSNLESQIDTDTDLADGIYTALDNQFYLDAMKLEDYEVNLFSEKIVCTENYKGTVRDMGSFSKSLKNVERCASTESKKHKINAVLLGKHGDNTVFVATDGFRLGCYVAPIESYTGDDVLIPTSALQFIYSIIDDSVEIYADKEFIVFKGQKDLVTIRIIAEKYVDYVQVFPKSFLLQYSVDRKKLLSVLKELAPIVKEPANIIKTSVTDGKLFITATNRSLNVDRTESLPITVLPKTDITDCIGSVLMPIRTAYGDEEVPPNACSLNVRLLMDTISGLSSEVIDINYNSHLSAIVIRPINSTVKSQTWSKKKIEVKRTPKSNVVREVIATNVMYCGKLCNKIKTVTTNISITYEPVKDVE